MEKLTNVKLRSRLATMRSNMNTRGYLLRNEKARAAELLNEDYGIKDRSVRDSIRKASKARTKKTFSFYMNSALSIMSSRVDAKKELMAEKCEGCRFNKKEWTSLMDCTTHRHACLDCYNGSNRETQEEAEEARQADLMGQKVPHSESNTREFELMDIARSFIRVYERKGRAALSTRVVTKIVFEAAEVYCKIDRKLKFSEVKNALDCLLVDNGLM